MVRLDFLVFGYRILGCESPADRNRLMAHLMHKGVASASRGKCDVLIRERDYLQNKDFISGQKCKCEDHPRGALPLIKSALRQRISLAALVIAIAVNLLATTVVWDVRVSGCERLSESFVEQALATVGVRVGASWRSLNAGQAETALLAAYPDLGWVSINRRGSVAYVSVKEADRPPAVSPEVGISNVVATVDCIITDINVTAGYAAVKVGEVVKRGDVLISGIPPAGSEGKACHASGIVLGEVNDLISVEIPTVSVEKLYGEGQKSGLSLNFLNFSLNIFKIYRNFTSEYVIIENNEKCRLFGKYDIPVGFVHEYSVPYTEVRRELDPAMLVELSSRRMQEAILARTEHSELLRARTEGGFTDGGYSMTTRVTVIEEIGKDSPLTVE